MDVKTPQPPTFEPNLDTIDAQVLRLDLLPDSIIVIKSNDVDVDVVRAVKEQFKRQVLGIGPNDFVQVLNVSPDESLVFSGDGVDDLDSAARAEIEAEVKKKTGCKAVIFLPSDTCITKLLKG